MGQRILSERIKIIPPGDESKVKSTLNGLKPCARKRRVPFSCHHLFGGTLAVACLICWRFCPKSGAFAFGGAFPDIPERFPDIRKRLPDITQSFPYIRKWLPDIGK